MSAKVETTPVPPIRLKSRSKDQPRELLFSVDDVEYTMPVEVSFGDALRLALLLPAQADDDARGMLLVRELCGPQALEALLADATVTRREWNMLVVILAEKTKATLKDLNGAKGS